MLRSSFRVGRYTCTLTATDEGPLTMNWKPKWPSRLTPDEMDQYRKGRDALLKKTGGAYRRQYRAAEV